MENKLQDTTESVKNKRSSKEIKQDLAATGENFSRTVEQLGEHIEEKLDWRGYMRKSPFWAVGAAAGLGLLAAGMVRRRTTPMERLMATFNSSVRSGLAGIAGPGLIKITLLGIAARTAANWLNKAPEILAAGNDAGHQTEPDLDSGEQPPADRDG